MSDERVLNVTEFLASWRNKDIRSYLEELGWQHVPEGYVESGLMKYI